MLDATGGTGLSHRERLVFLEETIPSALVSRGGQDHGQGGPTESSEAAGGIHLPPGQCADVAQASAVKFRPGQAGPGTSMVRWAFRMGNGRWRTHGNCSS
jgi:hypothetical protein